MAIPLGSPLSASLTPVIRLETKLPTTAVGGGESSIRLPMARLYPAVTKGESLTALTVMLTESEMLLGSLMPLL